MTFIHFVTCSTLCFAPIYILFKSSKLSASSNSYTNLIYGAITYSLALFAKMLLIATFLPSFETQNYSVVPDVTIEPKNGWTQSFVVYEVMKALLNMFDFFVLYLLFNRVKLFGSEESKVLGVGLGFAMAENLLSRAIPLFVGATYGVEFDWAWVRTAVHANISMYLYLAFSAMVYLFTRLEKNAVDRAKSSFAALLSIFILVLPILSQIVNHIASGDDPNTALIIHSLFTIVVAYISYNTFTGHISKKQK